MFQMRSHKLDDVLSSSDLSASSSQGVTLVRFIIGSVERKGHHLRNDNIISTSANSWRFYHMLKTTGSKFIKANRKSRIIWINGYRKGYNLKQSETILP